MRWADSPEQAEFRRELRARTRPPAQVDDDSWRPHPPWADPIEPGVHRGGRPRDDNPSPAALHMRRTRERRKLLLAEAEGSTLPVSDS